MPGLDPAALRAAAPADSLFNTLSGGADVVESMSGLGERAAELRAAIRVLVAECAVLRKDCRTLPERDHTALANPRGYALAERYALLLAAAAALGVWLEAHNRRDAGFLADPALFGGGDVQHFLLQPLVFGNVLGGAKNLDRIALAVTDKDGVAAIEPAPLAVGVPLMIPVLAPMVRPDGPASNDH